MIIADPNSFGVIIGAFGLGGSVAIIISLIIIKSYLPSYFSEKGKNLATSEDIAIITQKIENIRHEYNSLIEEFKARHQLRVASLDRRLQAHQEAFRFWKQLVDEPYSSNKAAIECQDWWINNCLYLEPTVRQSFVDSYTSAIIRNALIECNADKDIVTKTDKKVQDFPNILFAAIQLPSLSDIEEKSLYNNLKNENIPSYSSQLITTH